MKINKYLLALSLLVLMLDAKAQDDTANKALARKIDLTQNIYNADSLASGNYKDVLASFFQLAIKNLTGPKKEINFNSNPYAWMLRADSSLAVDSSYIKYRFLRRLNVSFDIRMDSNFRLGGFASGIKYAIINKRDITVSDSFVSLVLKKNEEFHKLNPAIAALAGGIDTNLQKRLLNQTRQLLTEISMTFNKLDKDVAKIIMQAIIDNKLTAIQKMVEDNPNASFRKTINDGFDYVQSAFQNKPLWTIGISDTSYSNGKLFKNVEVTSQFLKGVMHPTNSINLELDLKGTLTFSDNNLETGHKLNRQVFIFEPGVNLVLKGKNRQSYFEMKISGSYANIWKGLMDKETQISNTLNATLRIRILNELWIPLQIRYNPKSGSVFGFLNIATNFTGRKLSAGNNNFVL